MSNQKNRRNRIWTLTLNPALDLSGRVNALIPDEKNEVFKVRLDPGGNAINAGRVLKRLGSNPLLMGFIGGSTGQQLKDLLKSEKLRTQFTSLEEATRINVTVTNNSTHHQTRLSFPGARPRPHEVKRLLQRLKKLAGPGILIIGGRLPPGFDERLYLKILKVAQRSNLSVVLDVPGQILKKILSHKHPRLLAIKPNLEEFIELGGVKSESPRSLAKRAMSYLPQSALICISMGKKGALFVKQNGAWLAPSPRIKVRGTVGAGDSMVGALVHFLNQKKILTASQLELTDEKDLLDIFCWAVAAGAATAQAEGTQLANLAQIKKLRSRIEIVRIL